MLPVCGAIRSSVVWMRHSSAEVEGAAETEIRRNRFRRQTRGGTARKRGCFTFELERGSAQMTVLFAVRAPSFQIERDAARRHRKRQLEAVDVGHGTGEFDAVRAFFERDRQLSALVARDHRGPIAVADIQRPPLRGGGG